MLWDGGMDWGVVRTETDRRKERKDRKRESSVMEFGP